MEQRGEPRFKISKAVRLQVLDRMAGPSLGRHIDAEVVDISGSGMRLRMPVPVPCGAPVQIHDRNLLLLGEICRCVSEQGAYTVGIRVFKTLAAADAQPASSRAHP